MALTDAQRAEVRRFLGYPDASAGLYSQLEGRMTAISAAGEATVVAVLTDLATLETKLKAIWSTAHVTRAEEVELASPSGMAALRQEGRRLCWALGQILGSSVERTPFDTGSGSAGIAGRG